MKKNKTVRRSLKNWRGTTQNVINYDDKYPDDKDPGKYQPCEE